MIPCSEAVRQLWEQLEVTPTPQQAAALEAHLALCRRCCGEAAFAVELRGFLAQHGGQGALPPDVTVRLEALITQLEDPR